MFNTKYTENQYAFQLLDFAAERNRLKYGDPYFIECRQELLKLVDEQVHSAKFWHNRWLDLCKEIMHVAGLPDDFANHGTDDAFEIIRSKLSEK